MEQLKNKRDLYEARPFLIIFFGFLGVLNTLISPGTPWLSHLGQFCGVVLFLSAAKIIQWRRAYRRQWL